MKALSVRQPWAWLLASGHKDVENRSWATPHRGDLLIHASAKAMTREDWEFLANVCAQLGVPVPQSLPVGGIVGVVELIGCVRKSCSWWFDADVDGNIGWVIDNARELPFIPLKGKLGLFDVPYP